MDSGAGTKNKKLIFIGGGVLLGAAVILAVWWAFFVDHTPRGPKLMVGQTPYAYSCQAFQADELAQQLGYSDDKSKRSVSETVAYDPTNTKDKELDLLSVVGEDELKDRCTISFDQKEVKNSEGQLNYDGSSAIATISYYKDEDKADEAYDKSKKLDEKEETYKALDGLAEGDAGHTLQGTFQSEATDKEKKYVVGLIKHATMVVELNVGVPEGRQPGDLEGKLKGLLQGAIARIDDGKATKLADFSGGVTYGGKKFVDLCYKGNYVKFAQQIGKDVEFRPDSVSGQQDYLKTRDDEKTPYYVTSRCSFSFRTPDDKKAADEYKPQSGEDKLKLTDKYPHYLVAQLYTFENEDAAKKYVEEAKKKADKKPESSIEHKLTDLPIADEGYKSTEVLVTMTAQEAEAQLPNVQAQIKQYEQFSNSGLASGSSADLLKNYLQSLKAQAQELQDIIAGKGPKNNVYAAMVRKGQRVYAFGVGIQHKNTPFKTTDANIGDDEFKKAVEQLVAID